MKSPAKRVFLIVMDSLGVGEMPDAASFGDEGSNTLVAIMKDKSFFCPTLKELGLMNIIGCGVKDPKASYARMTEKSRGKDTTTGHWEIAGVISEKPMPVFSSFPHEIIDRFEKETGRKTLCNKAYSGTEVIKDYGEEHIKSGALIVYTSQDSVFQIAAHEDVVPIEELYKYCLIARNILNDYGVGRVIARPFVGEYPFVRTANRHDYSLPPPKRTLNDIISDNGLSVIGVGKISDIFAGHGITKSYRTTSNDDGMDKTIAIAGSEFSGLCFVNLVDFDSAYGHRNDVSGYAVAASTFDKRLDELLPRLRPDDILIITADHGCDPSTKSTDHSREYTPMLIYGSKIKRGVNLGTRETFADISATVLEYLGLDKDGLEGKSFLSEVIL